MKELCYCRMKEDYVKSGIANSEVTSKNGVLTQQLDFAIKTSLYCTMELEYII